MKSSIINLHSDLYTLFLSRFHEILSKPSRGREPSNFESFELFRNKTVFDARYASQSFLFTYLSSFASFQLVRF